jgi:TonB-linked SusC/RagA family outer membrane protein
VHDRSTLNLDLSVKQDLDMLTEGLEFRLKGAYNTFYVQNTRRDRSRAVYTPYYRTDVVDGAEGDSSVVYRKRGINGNLNYSEGYNRDRDWYAEAKLTYNQTFDDKHNVTAMALYNQERDYYLQNFSSIPRSYVGTVGRLKYGFDDRYLFEANLSYNGSENFAAGKRFGFFPAVSAGWVISNEPFMEDVDFVDQLKLRGSYGIVGNDRGVGRFLYLPNRFYAEGRDKNLGSSGGDPCQGYNFGTEVPRLQPAACEGRIGNQDVTWEKSYKQNYGLNMTLFDDKFDLTFDYFRERRTDILTTLNTVPSFVAADLPAVNDAVVKNRGFEVDVKWNHDLGDFSYRLNPHVSFARNELVEFDEVPPNEPYLSQVGEPTGQRFGYVFDGFYTQEQAENNAEGSSIPEHASVNLKPGDATYEDLNDDGVIDVDDRKPIGYPEFPEYTAGMTMGASYNGFDLTLIWAGATNVSRNLTGIYRSPFGGDNNRSLTQQWADNRWTPDRADEATFPRLTFNNETNNTKQSTLWLKDASYLRLKNAELGYTAELQSLKDWVGLSRMRLYVSGFNLVTFSQFDYFDPEQTGSNYSNRYPLMKVYNAGARFTF